MTLTDLNSKATMLFCRVWCYKFWKIFFIYFFSPVSFCLNKSFEEAWFRFLRYIPLNKLPCNIQITKLKKFSLCMKQSSWRLCAKPPLDTVGAENSGTNSQSFQFICSILFSKVSLFTITKLANFTIGLLMFLWGKTFILYRYPFL